MVFVRNKLLFTIPSKQTTKPLPSFLNRIKNVQSHPSLFSCVKKLFSSLRRFPVMPERLPSCCHRRLRRSSFKRCHQHRADGEVAAACLFGEGSQITSG